MSFSEALQMKNVTITLDEKTASWARVEAAKRNVSLSRMIGEMLAQQMRRTSEYERAMRSFLSREPVDFGLSGKPYPKRDELYDRGRLR